MTEMEKIDSEVTYHGRHKLILLSVSFISIIGLLFLTILTTNPIEDYLFFFGQVRFESVLIDILVIIFGVVGFLYFFILPGLPFLITSNGIGLTRNPKDYLAVLLFTGLGNYLTLVVGMVFSNPIISISAPVVMLGLFLCIRIMFPEYRITSEISDIPPIRLGEIRGKSSLTKLVFIVIISLSLVIRFLIFNSNWVAFSDVIQYSEQITSISASDYLLNLEYTARAPLFDMFGYLFSFFTPSPLASLKIISFMYSLLLFIPAYCILKILSKNRESSFISVAFPIMFLIYPWTTMMASVALQDILLTFYVMSFFVFIMGRNRTNAVVASVSAGLAFLCRYSLGILGPLGFVYLLYRDRRNGLKNSILFLISWSFIAGIWILRNLMLAGVPFSTVDEHLFSISNFIPGISNIIKELGMDRHGINTLSLWLTLIVVIFLAVRKEGGRTTIRKFCTLDYLLIYIVIIFQIITLSFFTTQQYRFLISIIWFFPILWVLLMDSFNIPAKHLFTAGWVLFNISHIMHITRTNWIFYLGRFPVTDFTEWTIIILPTIPTLVNLGMVLVSLSILVLVTFLMILVINPYIKNQR